MAKKNTVTVQKVDGSKKEVQTKNVSTKSTSSNVKNRLAKAYESRKPEVSTYDSGDSKGASLSVGGERVGGVTKNTTSNGKNYYGAYVDRAGDPNRGITDRSVNTPLGSIDYGYDGDTASLGYTSPIQRGSMDFNDGGSMDYVNYTPNDNGGATAWARRVNTPNQPNTYVIGADMGRDIDGYYDKEINTPIGTIGYGREGGAVYGSYTSPFERGREIYPSQEGYNDYTRFGNNEVGRFVNDADGTRGLYYNRNGNPVGELYSADWGLGDTAYGGAINTPFAGNYYNEVELPTGGMIGYGNSNGRLSADYTPAQGSMIDRLIRAIAGR